VEKRVRPSILALSRQNLPNLAGTSIEGVAKGAYTVFGGDDKPDAIVLATGALFTRASQKALAKHPPGFRCRCRRR